MMKSVRISEALHASADKEAAIMHRSTASQIEFWASIGRKAEALLDQSLLHELLRISMVDDAQAISRKNNQLMAERIDSGKLSSESVRFFDKKTVKNSKVKFSGSDF